MNRNLKILYFILFADFILSLVIIFRVPYTEIDWQAYMSEVESFLMGERDYMKMRGDTGPLVYPAGFVYLFSALRYLTNQGENIFHAQLIFSVFYAAFQFIIFHIYIMAIDSSILSSSKMSKFKAKIHYPLIFLCALTTLSRRQHSIFVLRLFNDCIAMLFANASLLSALHKRVTLSCLLFSLGVSIKMNVLLAAPALLAILCVHSRGSARWVVNRLALLCAGPQLLLGAPFLLAAPRSYLSRAFEFSRQFIFKWSVNWQMLDESVFLSKGFALALLLSHVALLAHIYWRWHEAGYFTSLRTFSPRRQVEVWFVTQFIGILCCRSLHYQFYSWYFSSLPFLLFALRRKNLGGLSLSLSTLVSLGVFIAIEICWNIFPPSSSISTVLLCSHLYVLYQILQ